MPKRESTRNPGQFGRSNDRVAIETCRVVKLTLKTKATVLATALVVGWLAAVGYLEHRQLGEDFVAVVREQQDALAASVADDLADKLETHLAVLEQSGTLLNARTLADPSARQEFLHRISAARPLFDGIGIVSLAGDVIANEPPMPGASSVSVRDRDYFQRFLASGRSTISKPVQVRTGEGAGVLMLAPVRDGEGKLLAAVAGGLHLQRANMLGQLAHSPVGRSGHFEVVTTGAAPVYVVHPDPARLLTAAPLVAGTNDVVTRKLIRGVDWELRVVLPAAEANAPVLLAGRRLLWQLSTIGLAAALCVWLGMYWLLRPLSTLHTAIRTLRQNPAAELRLDTAGQDERGALAREFEALMHALRRRQAELAAVTEASPLGIFRAELDGSLSYVNETYLNQHGLSREASQRNGWLQLVRPEQREKAWSAWLAALGQRKPISSTVRLTRLDGRRIVLSVRTAPLMTDGCLEGHVGTIEDITERIAAEKTSRMLATIFDMTSDYVVQTNARGNIIYMNPAARRATGLGAEQPLEHRNFAEFNPPQTNQLFARVITPNVNAFGIWLGETSVYGADRREIPVSHMVIAHRDGHGRIEHYSAVMRDVSQQAQSKNDLQRQTSTLRSVTDAIPAFVAVVGLDLRYRFVNRSFERWFGAERERIVGNTMEVVLGRDEFERSRSWIERVLGGETVHFEKHYAERRDASHLAISYVPLRLDSGVIDGFVSIAQDITLQKQEAVRLLQLSQRDPLTGLLNRAGFEEHLERCLGDGGGTSLALLYIDLDHFKPVNDQHGHPVGDKLLQLFAQRLRGLVRPTDAVARLGGDEFAVVLSGVRERANAHTVADKVIGAASQPFNVGVLRLNISASVGVAFGCDAQTGWQDLVTRADTMLYQAKEAGRGRQAGALH